jgi:hypothetical protein
MLLGELLRIILGRAPVQVQHRPRCSYRPIFFSQKLLYDAMLYGAAPALYPQRVFY